MSLFTHLFNDFNAAYKHVLLEKLTRDLMFRKLEVINKMKAGKLSKAEAIKELEVLMKKFRKEKAELQK